MHYSYEFTQATDARGRVIAKVRHGLLHLVLDVPHHHFLEDWVNTAYKPLPGCLVSFAAQGGQAQETLSWEQGHGVGYREEFQSGNAQQGSYVCFVTIATPKFTLLPGGPGTYVPPAPGEHGTPPHALVDPFTVPLLTPTPPPVVAPVVEGVAEGLAAAAASAVLVPLALILALILGSSTPAGGPGIDQQLPPPLSRDELRLQELVARHAAGPLTPQEEAELIALLGKVRGIHVQKLEDLVVNGPLKGNTIPLPGFHSILLNYTKRSKAEVEKLRAQFKPIRGQFVKDLATDPTKLARLKQAGLTTDEIDLMASGTVPKKWQVHHKMPLDDGGDNSVSNLMLIENDPYHKAVTNYQNAAINGLKPGETRVMQWPNYPGYVYP